MVNQLEKIVKRRRADFLKRKQHKIDDDVTVNMSNCSGASSMSTVPPLRIIVHEAAHAIPKWRRRRDNRGQRRSARARRIHDELMCFEEAACYNERWIRENPRHDTRKLIGGIPHVLRGNAWQHGEFARGGYHIRCEARNARSRYGDIRFGGHRTFFTGKCSSSEQKESDAAFVDKTTRRDYHTIIAHV